jgi:hypothetical protein
MPQQLSVDYYTELFFATLLLSTAFFVAPLNPESGVYFRWTTTQSGVV